MAFAALTIDLNARLAKFEQDMQRAGKSVDTLNSRVSAAAAGFKTAFGALGATLSVGVLASFAKSGIDAADALDKMRQRTGASVKTLAEWKLAADQSDTSMELLAKGLQRLTLSQSQAEQGYKIQAESLQRLGITARDPQRAFEQLADAVARSNDPVKTNADLNNVLGRSYVELLPLLQGGSKALQDSAKSSETFANAMERLAPDAAKFNDQITAMQSHLAGFAANILSTVVPALNTFFERIARIQLLHNAGASIGELLTGTYSANVADSIAKVNSELRITEKQLSLIPKDSFDPFGDRKALEDELSRLKSIKAALREISLAGAMALAEQQYKQNPNGSTSNAEEISCIVAGGKWDGKRCIKKSTTAKADPLASLLGSTDIGRLQEFDKQVALLNQRFNYGKKDADLYTQAMTKLVQTTFANNWKQAADDAEFFRSVEADGIATTQEWAQNLRDLANVDMGRLNDLLANTDFSRLQKSQEDMILLTKAFTDGIKDADGNLRKLSESEYLDAVRNRLGLLNDTASKTTDSLSAMAEQAGRNIQDSFAEFLFNPFDNGLKGMLQSFGQTIQKMIAQAVAADLAKRIFNWGDSGGGAGSLLGSVASAVFSGARADGGPVMPGGTYLVGERGPELFRPSAAGTIIPNGAGGGHTVNVFISGVNNAADVRNAGGQIGRNVLGMITGAQRYA